MSVELIVDAQMGSQLIGTKGCVINELESQSGAKINVEREGRNRDEKSVIVKGDLKNVSDAVNAILRRIGSTSGRSSDEANIAIPPACTTAIVGAGGSTVKRLQEETGAHINLPRKNSGEPGRVNITGESASVLTEAIMAIMEICDNDNRRNDAPRRFDDRREREPRQEYRAAPRQQHQERTVSYRNTGGNGSSIEFLLGSSLARALVGKGGSVVQSIERQTGSSVSISKSSSPAIPAQAEGDDENRTVTVRGGDRVQALKLCLEKLEDTINEPISSVHFQIPSESTSMVIGAKGNTVHRIQKEAHARIDVAKEGGSGTVSVSGTIRQIVKAADMIYEIVENDPKTNGGEVRSYRREEREVQRYTQAPAKRERDFDRREYSPAPKRQHRQDDSPAIELVVNARSVPKLVGPKGSVVNGIIEQSGAKVNIDKGGREDKSVVISGNADARLKGLHLVLKTLEEADGALKDINIRIPPRLITSVVGPKGTTVMGIETDTDAKVHIARRNGTEAPGSAQIVGNLDSIYEAIVKIDDIVNKEE